VSTTPVSAIFTTVSAYNDGPHNAAAANFGGVLRDRGADGASLTYNVTNSVNGTPIPGLGLSGSCTIPGGSLAQATGCGISASAGSASTNVTVGVGTQIQQHLRFVLNPLDGIAANTLAVLSGGTASAELFGGSAIARNTNASPVTVDFLFAGTTTDRHTSATSDFIGVLMDGGGDGVTLDYTLETLINGSAVAALTQSGTCAFGPGAILTTGGCLGNVTVAPASTSFASAAAGNFSAQVDFTLSGGDSFAGIGALRLFNAPTAVPEPQTIALLACGLLILLPFRRRGRM
jgi:hypothetical protein